MKRVKRTVFWLAALLLPLLELPMAIADNRDDFFESRIRPVLANTCFRCHGDVKTSGSLRVDSRDALLSGGDSGPAIVPGKPAESLLVRAIGRQEDLSAMPPEKSKALRPEQVRDFNHWIAAGAVWPAKTPRFQATRHWAFEPIRDVAAPSVQDNGWVKTSVDAFVRAKQDAKGKSPAPAADRRGLIRRATYDLTGLPPTPDEIDAFVKDSSPRAFEAVIDRLLASPAYGERWGRHWLDVVRYADTAGETADYPVPLAWRYRNYVIDAFNADKPYDAFVREQIAGDLMAANAPRERYAELATATGYLAISRRFGFDSENYHHLMIQDTIDTLGQSILGLTLGCARCHDHKFDPLSTDDYYGLYGIFDSTRYAFPGSEQKQKVRAMLPLVPPEESRRVWRDEQVRLADMAKRLAARRRPVPSALLRSLHDIDGDFELQAPAAGGSNGVLVPPWVYEGKIAVTGSAQSPFKNLYPSGGVGASVPAGKGRYKISQATHLHSSNAGGDPVFINLDFRLLSQTANAQGQHRFSVGAIGAAPVVDVLISSKTLSLQVGQRLETLGSLKPNEWYNLQLRVDLEHRKLSGRFGYPGSVIEFSDKPIASTVHPSVEQIQFCSSGPDNADRPAIEFDNLGVEERPIAAVSLEAPVVPDTHETADNHLNPAALEARLTELTGTDGDFEWQTAEQPPSKPWGPGPGSVVMISTAAQSPYRNVYAAGNVGVHMPNRAEYDGFGKTLVNVKPSAEQQLFVSFDFRCGEINAGGHGSWRYYLGHGPGVSAAIELHFNGESFFRRSAASVEAIAPLKIGEWYQVQLVLDLKRKTYRGSLASPTAETRFEGQFASGWDETIDYTFIDSYGHQGGVRPALDADNFLVTDRPILPLTSVAPQPNDAKREALRGEIQSIREQIAAVARKAEWPERELAELLVNGPFGMTYGVSEGTPHDVRIQLRGEPDQPGRLVARRFVKILGNAELPKGTAGSGRLELASWLTRPENPLTARVMVNRIWQHHFGQGLVKTPNDFGVRGLPPTHPELLDHLATEFIRSGWSVKAMHRLIMLSATYQQSSKEGNEGSASSEVDTTGDYASYERRRLSAEEIRDSILAVTFELDRAKGREHPFPSPVGWGYSQHGPFIAVYDHNKRSVYLMTQRLKRHPFLALFDGADPNASTADRPTTTVPTQALFFLNDPFVHRSAEAWSARLLVGGADESKCIEQAYRRLLGRAPTKAERAEGALFIHDYRGELERSGNRNAKVQSLAAYLRVLMGSNEFLYVD